MVIDTSALVAILQNEPERAPFNRVIGDAKKRYMSVGSFLECSIIIESRYGYDGVRDLDLFISKAGIELIPVDAEQTSIARRAYRQYGKGRHPTGLNFGDCFAYALARWLDQPLLFKGDDFSKTDVTVCPVSHV